ncbi:MAG: decaprenyl-phosphate phosphoribosyltransferase [Acidobacteria bacterium]|nr:decaprenyl-phosphate phosphoribosyltransferase [Acidobacteriota bacterium]
MNSSATNPAGGTSSGTPPQGNGGVLSGVVRSMRPTEYVKNTLAFAAIIFSGHFFERDALLHSLAAFAALCLTASAAYLYNDVRDREADRSHPVKRNRPIASGIVPTGLAVTLAIVYVAGGLGIALAINRYTFFTVLGYVTLTTCYSLFLKHIVILDVLALASGFVLRVITGAEAIQVEFSPWLVLCTFLLALFLGFGKRRHELVLLENNAQTHRPILGEYSPHFLDMMMAVVTAATMMSYVLYTMDPVTIARFHSKNLIYTSVFVLYGIFRYLYLVHQKAGGGNPAHMIYLDRPLQIAAVLWVIAVFLLRYWPA